MIDPSTLSNREPWPTDPRSQALLQRVIAQLRAELLEADRQIDALRAEASAAADRLRAALAKRDTAAAQLEQATREGEA